MSEYCKYCGSELLENAVFCSKCGKTVAVGTVPEPQFQNNSAAPVFNPFLNQPQAAPMPMAGRNVTVKSKVNIWERIIMIALVVLMVTQTMIALFLRPGWLRSKSGKSTVSAGGVDFSSLPDDAYISGLGDNAGNSSEYIETPAISTETLDVPEDGSAVAAECGAVIELGAHNAAYVPELTVTNYEPDTESLPDGMRCCYEISAGDVHEFDHYFDIRLPYDPDTADPNNEAGSVFAEYLNEETGRWELIPYDLDTDNHEVIIHTNHLSKFTPVTVKDGSTIYPMISTFDKIYMDDSTAMGEIKKIANREINEMKEDPCVQSFFYFMIYNMPVNLLNTYCSLREENTYSDDAKYEIFAVGDLKDSDELNFWTGWITTISADTLSYFDMFKGEIKYNSHSYAPSKMMSSFASLSNYLSAVTLIEKVLGEDDMKPDKQTLKEMYDFLIQYSFGELLGAMGVSLSFLYTLPVFLLGCGMDAIRNKLQDSLDNSVAVAIHEYYLKENLRPFLQKDEQPYVSDITGEVFKEKGVKKQSWETLFTQAYRNNIKKYEGDPDRLQSVIDAGLNADAENAYKALMEEQNRGEGEYEVSINGRSLAIVSLKDMSAGDHDSVIEKVKCLIMKDFDDKDVLTAVVKNVRSEMRQKLSDVKTSLRDGFDYQHTITIEEAIPAGKSSQFADCRIEFISQVKDGKEEDSGPQVVWKGKLNDKGCLTFNFSTYGYMLSGMPDQIKVYDKKKNEVVYETDFEVKQQTTKIVLGQQQSEGHWQLKETRSLMDNISDSPDLVNGENGCIRTVSPGSYYEKSEEVMETDDGNGNYIYMIGYTFVDEQKYSVPLNTYLPGDEIYITMEQTGYGIDHFNNTREDWVPEAHLELKTLSNEYRKIEGNGSASFTAPDPQSFAKDIVDGKYISYYEDNPNEMIFTLVIANTMFVYIWVYGK